MKTPVFVAPLLRITRRLAFKIFMAFWIAMALAGGVLLAVETTRREKLAQRWRGVTGDAFAVYATAAASDFENPQTMPARKFLSNLEQRTQIRAWLYDAHDREVSGYAPDERRAHPPWLRERIRQLVKRARGSVQTEFDDLEWTTLAAQSARAPSGQTFVLVGTLPSTRYDFWGAMPRVQVMRLLAILLTAGLVSWLLARHLTQPLELLRTATQRLARGDFAARAAPGLDRRHDELAELAADFDSMAGRIENLLRGQERLVAAQRRLLADVAHELRSPLARSTVALELARDALDEDVIIGLRDGQDGVASHLNQSGRLLAINDSLDRIESETGRLTELIDRLLVLSRLESGVQSPDQSQVDLTALVYAVAADADFEAKPQGREVRVIRATPCFMRGTGSLLRSAVENVVRNAMHYTPSDTVVEVSIDCEDSDGISAHWPVPENSDGCYTSELPVLPNSAASTKLTRWAIITVRDYGPGISQEELSEVFRPFYRVSGSRARQGSGAGLGLSITARAIELHGGQLRVCNCLDNSGLSVQLRLPLVSEN